MDVAYTDFLERPVIQQSNQLDQCFEHAIPEDTKKHAAIEAELSKYYRSEGDVFYDRLPLVFLHPEESVEPFPRNAIFNIHPKFKEPSILGCVRKYPEFYIEPEEKKFYAAFYLMSATANLRLFNGTAVCIQMHNLNEYHILSYCDCNGTVIYRHILEPIKSLCKLEMLNITVRFSTKEFVSGVPMEVILVMATEVNLLDFRQVLTQGKMPAKYAGNALKVGTGVINKTIEKKKVVHEDSTSSEESDTETAV